MDQSESFRTLSDLIRAHAEARPDAPAVEDPAARLSYRELDATADRVAASLQRDGVRSGDAVAICATASARYVAVFIGVLRAGAVVAPLSPSVTPAAFAAMVADAMGDRRSGADDGATGDDDCLLFVDAAAACQVRPEGAVRAAGPGGRPLRIVAIDADGDACADGGTLADVDGIVAPPACPDAIPWSAWLMPPGVRPVPVPVQPSDGFNLIYSSGTTGTPKGIVQPHSMRWAQINRGVYGYGPDAVTLLATPLYSNTTLVVLLPSLAHGGRVVLMPKFDAAGYLALAERHRATHTMLVPVQYQRLLALPGFDRFDLSSFRLKFSTSAPFSAALKAEVLRRWPGGLVEYYGMTEGGGTCILVAHEHPDKLHTVGQPGPGSDIRLIDEDGRELPANVLPAKAGEVVGEVVGHSPSMMTGYHRQPEKTREAEWFDAAGKRFIRTGDVGRFDADGFLILLDRRKDLIISGGFNLYPSDLEAVLREHPAVADAAVVGVPSAEWGEAPIGFVVRRSDPVEELADAPDEAGLRDWANARLGRMQRLASIEFVDELPRSAIGKVLKRSLRDDWVARRGAMAGARDTREIRWRPDPAAISSRGDQIR